MSDVKFTLPVKKMLNISRESLIYLLYEIDGFRFSFLYITRMISYRHRGARKLMHLFRGVGRPVCVNVYGCNILPLNF